MPRTIKNAVVVSTGARHAVHRADRLRDWIDESYRAIAPKKLIARADESRYRTRSWGSKP